MLADEPPLRASPTALVMNDAGTPTTSATIVPTITATMNNTTFTGESDQSCGIDPVDCWLGGDATSARTLDQQAADHRPTSVKVDNPFIAGSWR